MATSIYALADLPDVKLFMGVAGADSDMDNIISGLINQYSAMFETYMSRNILSRSYTETYDGGGYHMLFTTQYPITSISGIHDSAEWVWSTDTLIDSDEYTITIGDHLNAVILRTLVFGDHVENVKITYTAGYSAVPLDIQHCMVEEVVKAYRNKDKIGVTSKSIGDDNVMIIAQGLLEKTIIVLNQYRRLEC